MKKKNDLQKLLPGWFCPICSQNQNQCKGHKKGSRSRFAEAQKKEAGPNEWVDIDVGQAEEILKKCP